MTLNGSDCTLVCARRERCRHAGMSNYVVCMTCGYDLVLGLIALLREICYSTSCLFLIESCHLCLGCCNRLDMQVLNNDELFISLVETVIGPEGIYRRLLFKYCGERVSKNASSGWACRVYYQSANLESMRTEE